MPSMSRPTPNQSKQTMYLWSLNECWHGLICCRDHDQIGAGLRRGALTARLISSAPGIRRRSIGDPREYNVLHQEKIAASLLEETTPAAAAAGAAAGRAAATLTAVTAAAAIGAAIDINIDIDIDIDIDIEHQHQPAINIEHHALSSPPGPAATARHSTSSFNPSSRPESALVA